MAKLLAMKKSKDSKKKPKDKSKPPTSERTGARKPPPKKTGKSGIGPKYDPADQSEAESTTLSTTLAAAADAVEEPAGELVDTKEGSLMVAQPPKPVVVGDRVEAHFLKPTFSRTAKGKRLVSLHITFPMTDEHTEDGLLPKRIRDDWSLMTKHGRTTLGLGGIPGQRVCFFLSSDAPEDDPKLVLPAAQVTNVSLAVVQKKGDGEAKKVIRLSFRLLVPVSHEVAEFVEMNYGANYWIKLEESQDKMFDEGDD